MKHIALKSLSSLTKILLVFLIFIMICAGAAIFTLSKGPINLDFAKEYIQAALSDKQAGYTVTMSSLYLEWERNENALLLTLDDLGLSQGKAVQDLKIEKARLGLSLPFLLVGEVRPTTLLIEGPVLNLVKTNGAYDLFWEKDDDRLQNKKAIENKEPLNKNDIQQKLAYTLAQIAKPTEAEFGRFSALKEIVLKDAVIEVETHYPSYIEKNYLVALDLNLRRTSLGLDGNLATGLVGADERKSSMRADLSYRKKQKDLTFNGQLIDVNPAQFADLFGSDAVIANQKILLNGTLKASLNPDMKIENAVLNIKIPEGEINIPHEYDAPISINDAAIDVAFHRLDKKIILNALNANIGGIPIAVTGAGSFEKGLIHLPLSAKIDEVQFDNIAKLFPKSERESSAADWISNRLIGGRTYDVVVSSTLKVMRDPETSERVVTLDAPRAEFKFEDLTVKYSDTLMPVTQSIGSGVYENDSLTITAQSGFIGEVKGTDVNVTLTDLAVEGGGFAKIKVKGQGPLKTILTYIAAEPIALNEKEIGIDAKAVAGNISFDLALEFPTLKDLPKEEVTVVINGTLSDIKLPNIVRSLELTGGPYQLGFEKGKVSLSGKGQLSGRAIDLDYQQFLDPTGKDFDTKVTASLSADKELRDVFGIDLDDYISGEVPIDVIYTDKGKGNAVIDVKGVMAPTIVHIEPFQYRKEPGVAGDFSLQAIVKNDVIQEIDRFNLKTTGLELNDARILFRTLNNNEVEIARGNITSAILGRTKAKVDFEVTPDNVLKVVANGPVVDLSAFLDQDKKTNPVWQNPKESNGQAMKISFKADKVFTVKDEFIRGAQFYVETDGESDITRIEIDAKVGDQGDFYVRFKPEGDVGQRTFRLESSDAGATLKAFDLYKDMRGGSILIYGRPQRGDFKGDIYGTAQIENFSVVNAPALARLLGAMSLSGVQDTLSTKGVSFTKLEAGFEWRFRDEGNLLVIKDGRTSGSSLGLTFEGVNDMGAETIDISGTVIPLSGVNKVIGDIPLIGDILTGGSAGGLFAATYTMSGPSKDPKVIVNPLSVLTPGIFRKMLFEGGVESKLPENKNPSQNVPANENKTDFSKPQKAGN